MRPSHRIRGARRAGLRRRLPWLITIALAIGVVRVAFFLASRSPEPAEHGTGGPAAQAESLNAAERRRDWAGAEADAERLAAGQPGNPEALCELALALHNSNSAAPSRFNRPRPSRRLSLDRIAAEMRVLTLLDSAVRLASTPEQGARARMLRGAAFESLGLPIEALECYRAARERAPRLERAALAVRRMSAQLADPRAAYSGASDSTGSPAPTQRAHPRASYSVASDSTGSPAPTQPR